MEAEEVSKETEGLFVFARQYAEMKLRDEERREQLLLSQSVNMQSAFSIMIVAIFMLLPIIIEHRGDLSLEAILSGCSIVVGLLLMSLLFASSAQNRQLYDSLGDVDSFYKEIMTNYELYLNPAQQNKAFVEAIIEIQTKRCQINNLRVKRIRRSMTFFYLALAVILLCFIASVVFIAIDH